VANGTSSNRLPISCGVPQGSILGPLFFLIYINDLPNATTKLTIINYADDTNVFLSGKNLNQLIHDANIELNKLSIWFSANKLTLNITKTKYMIFHHTNKKIDIDINQAPILINKEKIDYVTSVKFLGLLYDQNLTWKNHIQHVAKKIAKNTGILSKIRFFIDQETALVIYNTLINSYTNYCNGIWANNYIGRYDSITKIQKKAIRLVSFTKIDYHASPDQRLAHTAPLFAKFSCLNIQKSSIYNSAITMYKLWTGTLATPTLYDIVHRPNRGRHPNFFIPYVETNSGKLSFAYSGPKIWNNLPPDVKASHCISIFKRKCKSFLINANLTQIGKLFWNPNKTIIFE
jgi:hypothetical protein